MSSASSATAGDPGTLLRGTHAVLQARSVGELMLTMMRKSGTRVVTRQSWVDFVPRRGIMSQIDPHFIFTLLSLLLSCHVIIM